MALTTTPAEVRKHIQRIRSAFPALPHRQPGKKLTLVIDLDSTVLHSSEKQLPGGIMYTPGLYTVIRPGTFNFLNTLSSRVELIIFTAGTRDYANHMADAIDPLHKHIKYIFARDETVQVEGGYYKFMELLNTVGIDRRHTRPIHTILMIDDNPMFVHPTTCVLPTTKFEGVEKDHLFFQRIIREVQSVLRVL